MIEMQHALAQTVRERLKEQGKTQRSLARDIGVTAVTISNFLNNRVKLGDITMFKIQKWLDNGGASPKEEERRSVVEALRKRHITNATQLHEKVLADAGYSHSTAKMIFSNKQKQYCSQKVYGVIRAWLYPHPHSFIAFDGSIGEAYPDETIDEIFSVPSSEYAPFPIHKKTHKKNLRTTEQEEKTKEPETFPTLEKTFFTEMDRMVEVHPYTTILEWMAEYEGEFTRKAVIAKLKEVFLPKTTTQEEEK